MDTSPSDQPLDRSLRLITVAGSLAMVYTTCVGSPVTTQLFRSLGATEVHFGWLGGLPMIMLFMQFIGAYAADRQPRRKPFFMVLAIACRLLYLAVALLPLLLPSVRGELLVPWLILILGLSSGLGNLTVPVWFSWMGDVIPRRILNRYWGARQRYMTSVWAVSFLVVALFAFLAADVPVRVAFLILVTVGCAAGVADILLFRWVPEPPNVVTPERNPLPALLKPLRHPEYRSLVIFGCAFSAATMVGAAFMQVYVLKVLDLPVWKVTLIWCSLGVGSAYASPTWGRIADRHGHRPVLLLCVALKPLVCIVFMLVTPATALPVLGFFYLFDSMLNAGYAISVNGYMLKLAPRENRSMFIAATTALSGICGGIGAIAGGTLLRHTQGLAFEFAGRTWGNYQLLFALSFILRVACVPIAAAVREPASATPYTVLTYLMGIWPMRMLVFPLGLYRRVRGNGDSEDAVVDGSGD